jgi:cell division protease FtsH
MEKETLQKDAVLRIFERVQKRPSRGSYTGYGKRLPSDKAPVQTPRDLALLASGEADPLGAGGSGANGSSTNGSNGSSTGSVYGGSHPTEPAGEHGEGTSGQSGYSAPQ